MTIVGVIGDVRQRRPRQPPNAEVTRLLGTMLFQVQPYDPLTYAGGLVFPSVVTFVACYIPATRAAGVDPLKALRVD